MIHVYEQDASAVIATKAGGEIERERCLADTAFEVYEANALCHL